MKFTARSLEALKPQDQRYEVWEDNGKGFGLRVSPTGRKTFIYMYRFEGKPRRMTLGQYPKLTLAQAHAKHAEARYKLERGIDPGAELTKDKAARQSAPTIEDLISEYIERYAKPNKKSWKSDERTLRRELIDVAGWGKRKAEDITRRDCILVIDGVVDRGSPIMANRLFAVMRKMFKFAVMREIVPFSPCAEIQAPAKENRRDRALSDNEIAIFWKSLDGAPMTDREKTALRLLLATAQRKIEVLSAEKSEFDLASRWWTIPAERSKNKKPHRVWLNDLALDLVHKAMELSKPESESADESRFLFPNLSGEKPITETALNKALERSLKGDKPAIVLDWFTPHDLRRTAATQMGSLGVTRFVIGKVLNHSDGSVTAIYDHHSYDKEKQQALDALGRKLEGIISGKKANVVTLLK